MRLKAEGFVRELEVFRSVTVKHLFQLSRLSDKFRGFLTLRIT